MDPLAFLMNAGVISSSVCVCVFASTGEQGAGP